jgi:hypothetical protein
MVDEDVPIRFPVNGEQRWRNRLGRLAAGCIVTERWLQFEPISQVVSPGNDMVTLRVMTMSYPDLGETDEREGKPRRLAELLVSRADLLRALESVETRPS